MECRTLDITLISAKGLKKASLIGKMDVYALVYISGAANTPKLKTPVHKDGGSDPSWNFPMKFTVDEAAGLQNRLTLVVEIKHDGTFGDKDVGVAHVPIKELLDGLSKDGTSEKQVSYQVRTPSGKQKGSLNFSYKFGEKFTAKAVEEAVTAYPAAGGMAVGSSSGYQQPYGAAPGGYYPPGAADGYPPQPQPGYAYQQQQPGYGYPPPPPPGYAGYPPQQPGYGYPPVQQPQQKPPKKNGLGMGLGAGLLGGALGGLLIADIASDAGGGCGGGCGGF